MQIVNSQYILAGLLQGIVQLFQKSHTEFSKEEIWIENSKKFHGIFTEEILGILKSETFQKVALFNPSTNENGNSLLKSIFSGLLAEEKIPAVEKFVGYFQPCSFDLSDSVFPVSDYKPSQDVLQKLWSRFEAELKGTEFKKLSENETILVLYELLKKYASYVPAPNNSLINIFEHARLNSALAHCISLAENQEAPFLLVSGDISGIQSFIYNISNKKAMVSLKGRSFYVQLLAETISKELAERCGISVTHQIYAAGGKFYLLCPNTLLVKQEIEKYSTELQKWIWEKFNGKISVQLESLSFNMNIHDGQLRADTDIENNIPLGQLWKALSDKTSEAKKRKFQGLLFNGFDAFFNPSGRGGDVKVCAVTSEELSSDNSILIKDEETNKELNVSKAVDEQIQIGQKLYNAKFLVEGKSQTEDSFQIGINTHWKLLSKLPSTDVKRCIAISHQSNIQIFQNNAIIQSSLFGGIPMAFIDNKPATLEDLCKSGENTESLAVLRMDVDNLGSLFMNGFGSKADFALMAKLSAALDTYFSGYLNTIRNQDQYKHTVNIVYAGGDDVFAIGRWDKIIEFAIDIKAGFKKLVCGREDISISGGIAITGVKFPIAKAAELAADAEELAKNFQLNGKEKNALALFGIAVSFETEMPFIIEFKNALSQWVATKQISRGLLFKLFSYYQMYLDEKPDWKWQSAYTMARYEETSGKDQKDIYTLLKELLFANTYKNKFHNVRFEAIIVACRWAELLTKNQKSNA